MNPRETASVEGQEGTLTKLTRRDRLYFPCGLWRGWIVQIVCLCLLTKRDLVIGGAWNAPRCPSA